MSGRRKFSAEFKVLAAHRVIDSGRSVSKVARELTVGDMPLGRWVRGECARMEAAEGTDFEPLNGCPRYLVYIHVLQIKASDKNRLE